MRLTVFGCGEGRLQQRFGDNRLIVANLDGNFGGTGDPSPFGLGLPLWK
jgi:hypothetical protein